MSPVVQPTNSRRTGTAPVKRTKKTIGIVLIAIIICAGIIRLAHTASGTVGTKKTVTPLSGGPAIVVPPVSSTDAGLQHILTAWAGQHSFTSSISAVELSGAKRTAVYNQTQPMIPASTYKLYVAYGILHGVELGTYSLSQKTDDGNTVQIDLNNMILNSDNDAARTLGFLVGWKNINALLRSRGITNTNLYNYVPPSTQPVGDKHTTAGDLAAYLQQLQAGKLLNTADTQLLLGLLKTQHFRERIPAGVPNGVAVADKPGWLGAADGINEYVENDAAVVYGPKSSYILVIMTNNNTATTPLATLSRQVYDYLER